MSIRFKEFAWAGMDFAEIDTIEATEPGQPRIYKTPNGHYPSMTSILGVIKDDDGGLESWVARVGEEEAHKIMTDAGKRGNQLHDINEKYLRNELTRDMIKGQGGVLFNRVKKHLDRIDLVVACEVALYSDTLKYAGRTDAVGVIDDKLMIIDHKNSRRPFNFDLEFSRKKCYKYMLQTTGYQVALEEMTGLVATHGCLIVGNHLTSNSDMFIFEIEDFLKDDLYEVAKAYHSGDINKSKFNYYNIGTKNEKFPRVFT